MDRWIDGNWEMGRDGMPKVLDLLYLVVLPGGLECGGTLRGGGALMAAPYIPLKLVYIVWISAQYGAVLCALR